MVVTFAFFLVVVLDGLCSLTNHFGPFLNKSCSYKIGPFEAKKFVAAPSLWPGAKLPLDKEMQASQNSSSQLNCE